VRKAGICLPQWRKLVCGVMIVIAPTSLMAQSTERAILYSSGGAWLNGNPAPSSSAIFPHDWIRTQHGTAARVDADGSTFTVEPETIVQFEGDELVLDHGTLQVNTFRGMRVRVDCLTVIPPAQEWARYDVTDVDGKVVVLAHQNDVKIHYRGVGLRGSKAAVSSDVTVEQGGQATREEQCPAAAKLAAPGANKAWLDTWYAKGAGLVAVGVVVCKALCFGGEPVSPSMP
jgi:hypothetical protein